MREHNLYTARPRGGLFLTLCHKYACNTYQYSNRLLMSHMDRLKTKMGFKDKNKDLESYERMQRVWITTQDVIQDKLQLAVGDMRNIMNLAAKKRSGLTDELFLFDYAHFNNLIDITCKLNELLKELRNVKRFLKNYSTATLSSRSDVGNKRALENGELTTLPTPPKVSIYVKDSHNIFTSTSKMSSSLSLAEMKDAPSAGQSQALDVSKTYYSCGNISETSEENPDKTAKKHEKHMLTDNNQDLPCSASSSRAVSSNLLTELRKICFAEKDTMESSGLNYTDQNVGVQSSGNQIVCLEKNGPTLDPSRKYGKVDSKWNRGKNRCVKVRRKNKPPSVMETDNLASGRRLVSRGPMNAAKEVSLGEMDKIIDRSRLTVDIGPKVVEVMGNLDEIEKKQIPNIPTDDESANSSPSPSALFPYLLIEPINDDGDDDDDAAEETDQYSDQSDMQVTRGQTLYDYDNAVKERGQSSDQSFMQLTQGQTLEPKHEDLFETKIKKESEGVSFIQESEVSDGYGKLQIKEENMDNVIEINPKFAPCQSENGRNSLYLELSPKNVIPLNVATQTKVMCSRPQGKIPGRRQGRPKMRRTGPGFVCEMCGKSFSHNSNLSRHRSQHKKPMFACDFCDLQYKRKDYLKKHMQDAHKVQTLL